MPLQLLSVQLSDFDRMLSDDFSTTGDLISPLTLRFYPVSNPAEERARTVWSIEAQRGIFQQDQTAHFIKVVDDATDEIIALARWHFYPTGYYVEYAELEKTNTWPDLGSWPDKPDGKMVEPVLMPHMKARRGWMGEGPQWVLTTLMTKAPQRKRGAGGMLVNWGLEQARRDNAPAFLEAGRMGVSLYEKLGFQRMGEVVLNLEEWGMKDSMVIERMGANLDGR